MSGLFFHGANKFPKKVDYSFSHNHGCGKWPLFESLQGNDPIGVAAIFDFHDFGRKLQLANLYV